MTGVWDPAGVLAVAGVELPLSADRADAARGSVVVVPGGTGWGAVVTASAEAGAAAIVLVEPRTSEPAEPGHVPVVVLRSLLRDAPARSSTPAAVVAEVAGPAPALPAAVRDALAWIRVLAGAPVELRAHDATAGGALVLLEAGKSRLPATLAVRPLSGVPDGAAIRVTALGLDRHEVIVDEAAGVRRPALAGSGYESSERAALRRALRLAESGKPTTDLAELAADVEIARRILNPAR